MDKGKWAAAAAIAASLLLLAIPFLWPQCPANMRCQQTFKVEFFLASMALFIAIVYFSLQAAQSRRLAAALLIILGIGTLIVPQSWFIGICQAAHMHCQQTVVWVWGSGSLLILSGLTILLQHWHKTANYVVHK